MRTDSTVPDCWNSSRRSSSVAWKERLPTNNFAGITNLLPRSRPSVTLPRLTLRRVGHHTVRYATPLRGLTHVHLARSPTLLSAPGPVKRIFRGNVPYFTRLGAPWSAAGRMEAEETGEAVHCERVGPLARLRVVAVVLAHVDAGLLLASEETPDVRRVRRRPTQVERRIRRAARLVHR